MLRSQAQSHPHPQANSSNSLTHWKPVVVNTTGECAEAVRAGFYREDISPLRGSQDSECVNIYERWTKEVKAISLDQLAQEFNLGTY